MISIGPVPTSEDAESIARDLWGLECRVEPLAGEVDRNFLLTSTSGDRWVLKISREGADEEALDCQIQALRFLESSPVAHLVQRVLAATDGSSRVPIIGDRVA